MKRGNLSPTHAGTLSPIHEAEKALVIISIQMGKIRQPLSCAEGVALMNDLIKDTPMQDALKEFQMVRYLGRPEFEYGTLTQGWWKGFKHRNGHLVVSKRGERFACSRADWTKESNLAMMYNVIYDEMIDAGIAERRASPRYTDRVGNEVEESQRFGLKQDTKIIRPEYLLFADETGCSTSQKKDGQVGGTKYLCKKGTMPQMTACTNDHRFTVLPFTSSSGEAVCCAVIFQSKTGEVPINWKSGVDI